MNSSSNDMQREESDFRTELLEAKIVRKKAEEDAQLLANRIALLQAEERKTMKRIEETKKKAKEIVELKVRNAQMQKEKEEIRRQREEEEIQKMMANKGIKERTRTNQEVNRNQLMSRLKDDVDLMRKTKQDVKDYSHLTRQEVYTKNSILVDHMRSQKKEAQEKKKKQLEEVKQKARIEYENKIQGEVRMKEKTDDLISRLEQQEMELIQRLQNTHSMQKQAFEDLEKALVHDKRY